MSERDRPNILFLFPDQHRHDWLGSHPGMPVRTPHLDGLAARGVRFTNAICPSPLCAPSRACLAAGKVYDRCQVADNQVDYPLDQPTFYAMLRDAGYRVLGCGKFDLHKASPTWGVAGKHLLHAWGFSDGIDNEGKWDGVKSGRDAPQGPYLAFLEERGLRQAHIDDFMRRCAKDATFATPLPDDAYCDNWLAQNGIDLLRATPVGEPWFLQVNFTGPHDPWDITASMEASCREVKGLPAPNGNTQLDAQAHERVRQNYTAMVENIDRWLGIYLNEVAARGELDDTLVVYSSDHGEMLGDHDLWSKVVPYQPSVGVPLIVAGPGVAPGRVVDVATSTMDLTATLIQAAGLVVPAEMDSRPLQPVLAGQAQAVRPVALSGLNAWRMVFDGRYKLVIGDGRFPMGKALFDLRADPGENENLVQARPEVVRQLNSHLDWVE